jgi:uncharacterized RmlC-like cupin family protein
MATGKVEVFKVSAERANGVSAAFPVDRQDLIARPDVWMGVAYTASGVPSSWHHHNENDTYGYVISGRLRLEFGPGGGQAAEVGPGEAFHVPSKIVHREVTVGDQPGVIFVVRVGSGIPVSNVDAPEAQ